MNLYSYSISQVSGRFLIISKELSFISFFQVLLKVFTYLSHREIVAYSLVCKKWHMIAQEAYSASMSLHF